MSDQQHTPGPWKVYGGPSHLRYYTGVIDSIPDVDGKVVANSICHVSGTNEDADANARLIAAAPELLEACQKMLEAFEYAGTRLVGAEYHAKEALKAAVDKATASAETPVQ